MPQPLTDGRTRWGGGPSFLLVERARVRPGVLLLATVVAFGGVGALVFAMSHPGRRLLSSGSQGGSAAAAGVAAGAGADGGDDDDPSQVDTFVLGDPGDAPVAVRKGERPERTGRADTVHPFVIVRLPSDGSGVGQIPDSPAGRLLFDWLAAFNRADSAGLESALPNVASGPAAAAQMELRRATGGFSLLVAKEVEPGVLVFRVRDQTAGMDAVGTLQVDEDVFPAQIKSFSLTTVSGR